MSIFGKKKSILTAVVASLLLLFFALWFSAAFLQNAEGDGPATLDWLAVAQAVIVATLVLFGSAFVSMLVEKVWFTLFYHYTTEKMEKDFWQALPSEVAAARWRCVVALAVRLTLFITTLLVLSDFR